MITKSFNSVINMKKRGNGSLSLRLLSLSRGTFLQWLGFFVGIGFLLLLGIVLPAIIDKMC